LYDFEIAETKEFRKNLKKLDTKLYEKIKNIIYPQLRSNPFFSTNINKLKGELEVVYPNPEIEIHDYALSSNLRVRLKFYTKPLNTSMAHIQRILFRNLGIGREHTDGAENFQVKQNSFFYVKMLTILFDAIRIKCVLNLLEVE